MISAVSLEVVDGGSLRGFSGTNLTSDGARAPFFLRLGNRGWGQHPPTPGTLEDIAISGLSATQAVTTSSIVGMPGHYIRNVTLKDISISSDEAGTASWADRTVPEMENAYPEARMLGKLPASGLYCRHADGIRISNCEIRSTRPDARPALVFDEVADLTIERFSVDRSQGARPIIDFMNVQKAIVRDCTAPPGTDVYLGVKGSQSQKISLQDSDLKQAKRPVAAANPAAVTIQH